MKQYSNKHIKEHLNNTKILLYSVIVALIVGVAGMGFCIKNLNGKLNTKSYQINLLINEIGKMKNENQYLYQSVIDNNNYTSKSFEAMNEIYDNFEQYFEEKFNEKLQIKNDKILTIQEEYEELISEKENALNNLKNRNNLLSDELDIKAENKKVFHLLILGIKENLTDTIMLASINTENETVTLISIPRDLYVNGRKINSIFSTYGIEKFKKDIYSVTGVYAYKHVIVDINAFKQIIDSIGGIDLYVRKDIYDPYFPTASNGYTVYQIKEGSHHMDGEEALMYVRSRKTTSDFDRSERQQQVLQAVRVKLKKIDILGDLEKAKDIFFAVISNIETNIDFFEALHYMQNYQNYAIESGNVLNTGNFLYASRTNNGQYILLPRSGGFYEIKSQIASLINE